MSAMQCPSTELTFHRGVFITGTDTGVGKTAVTAALAWTLERRGETVIAWKPVQTGVGPGAPGDDRFVAAALGESAKGTVTCTYRFREPAAPLVAARAENGTVELERLLADWATWRHGGARLLVEGAGGLLVPLAEGWSMADLAKALDLPLLIVARPGLGTLNHTLLTLEAARVRHLPVLGIVLAGWRGAPDLATATNPWLLTVQGRVPLLGVLPWDAALSVEHCRIGSLREWAPSALAPSLGGSFDPDAFLAQLPRPN